jgi:hypothetical protein
MPCLILHQPITVSSGRHGGGRSIALGLAGDYGFTGLC